MAGYSSRPLAGKLGLKPAMRAAVLEPPDGLLDRLGHVTDLEVVGAPKDLAGQHYEYLHLFTRRQDQLAAWLPQLRAALSDSGMLWVSWPKRASRVATDVTENLIRAMATAHGLVDVKVCAVDEVWSGLKLVIPLALRKAR